MNMRRAIILLGSIAVSSLLSLQHVQAEGAAKSYYLIGNSLTWDTVPPRLDGDVQWHVDCGKSLPFIFEHPEKPCVKSSTLWPTALKKKQYDVISVQPHYGPMVAQDADVISKWVAMQPGAEFVIHTGWAHHAKRAEEYASTNTTGPLQHSRAYFDTLLTELRKRHPKRTFRRTRAIDLLATIAVDINAGKAPLKAVSDLHRDAIHVKIDSGRYLMHNAMRHALRQPLSTKGFEKLDPKLKVYLESVLATLK
jgi:hypothetical protein